ADIFERHFHKPAKINNPSRWKRKDDTIGQGKMHGPYLAFALIACGQAGIDVSATTVRRALLRRPKSR
ncbi:hypothetical protein AB4144_58345, partial [Rhizobiaceae sp. 2RAB30]